MRAGRLAFLLGAARALVSGAPAMSNVISFVWANVDHGRERVRLMMQLQAAFALCVGLVSLAPRGGGGLALTVVAVAFTADRFDDELAARFGGRVHDAAGNVPG